MGKLLKGFLGIFVACCGMSLFSVFYTGFTILNLLLCGLFCILDLGIILIMLQKSRHHLWEILYLFLPLLVIVLYAYFRLDLYTECIRIGILYLIFSFALTLMGIAIWWLIFLAERLIRFTF